TTLWRGLSDDVRVGEVSRSPRPPRDDSRYSCPANCTGSCELPQKTQIILRKQADIGNVEQNHRQPVHSETESEPGPFFRIIRVVTARLIDCFENGGMHPAPAANFDPLFAALQRTRFHLNPKTR